MSCSRIIIFIFCCLSLAGCIPIDPTCRELTSLAPGKFWHPTDDHIEGNLNEEWPTEKTTDLSALQQQDVQIVDLLDLALQLNPNTQLTWANARAAAFNVDVQRSALYPSVQLFEEYNISDVRYDDGNPIIDTAADDIVLTKKQFFAFLTAIDPKARRNSSFVPPPRLSGPGVLPCLLNPNANGPRTVDPILNNNRAVTGTNRINRTANVTNTANATATTGQAANAAIANATAGQAFGSFGTGAIGSSRNLIHDLSVSYLLLDFGGRQASIEAARQALYNSDWIHNRQIQQVIIVVLRDYYNLIGLISLLEARQSDLKNAKTNYESARALFEAGIRNKLDVLQAQTDLINIQLNIVDINQQKDIAYGNLANSIGLPANYSFNIPPIPDDLLVDVSVGSIDDLIEKAIKIRPDLAATYAEYEQRRAQVVIARSQGLPTVNAQFDLRSFNDLINPDFNTHSISGGIFVSVPLFSGFLYVSQEREARELVRAASANVHNTELLVTLDVLTSYYSFKASVESLRYTADYLKYSAEAYEAALATYQEGISTILDLLSSQRALADAKARHIQARTNWAIALSNISFAMGTLGTEKEIKPWEQRKSLKGIHREK